MPYEWDFNAVWRSIDIIAIGGLATLKLTAACLALAIPVGLLLAIARLFGHRAVSLAAAAYVDFFRTAPSLVLIFWFFFAFPIVFSLDMSVFLAACLAIGLQGGAYFAEVFRGGVNSIHKGQWEAARAIGMTTASSFRYVILPQAFRHILPVFFTRTTLLLKTTTLASAIAYPDIVQMGLEVSSTTYRPIETFSVIAVVFFVVIFMAARGIALLERYLARIK